MRSTSQSTSLVESLRAVFPGTTVGSIAFGRWTCLFSLTPDAQFVHVYRTRRVVTLLARCEDAGHLRVLSPFMGEPHVNLISGSSFFPVTRLACAAACASDYLAGSAFDPIAETLHRIFVGSLRGPQ